MLDVSASCDLETNSLSLFIVNRSLAEDIDVDVSVAGRCVVGSPSVTILTGDDPKAHNSWEAPSAIKPDSGNTTVQPEGKMLLKLPSLNLTVASVQLDRQT